MAVLDAQMITIGGAAVFAATVAAMHVVRRDISPRERGVSRYASGRTLAPMTLAFIALAASVASAGASLETRAPGTRLMDAAAWFMWVGAAGMVLVAVAPEPSRDEGHPPSLIHTGGALVFFVAMPIAATMSASSFGVTGWTLASVLIVDTALFFAGIAGVPHLRPVRGLLQRCCFATIVAWLIAVACVP